MNGSTTTLLWMLQKCINGLWWKRPSLLNNQLFNPRQSKCCGTGRLSLGFHDCQRCTIPPPQTTHPHRFSACCTNSPFSPRRNDRDDALGNLRRVVDDVLGWVYSFFAHSCPAARLVLAACEHRRMVVGWSSSIPAVSHAVFAAQHRDMGLVVSHTADGRPLVRILSPGKGSGSGEMEEELSSPIHARSP